MSTTEMPVYLPSDFDGIFPDPLTANRDIIAVGGNLSSGVLLSAYRKGIFPWFSEDSPILWWSLNPRFVLFPQRIHVSRSLKKCIRKNPFVLTLDKAFEQVLAGCRDSVRPGQDGTWITPGMFDAYGHLHALGYAHSVEAWLNGELAGGLYGVALGGCFYGESMFSRVSNASKMAFTALCGALVDSGFGLVDCQQHTVYMESFGAVDMPRENFLCTLEDELTKPTFLGNWGEYFNNFPESSLWNRLSGEFL